MKSSQFNWRLWSSIGFLVASLILIWPTISWYSLPRLERDRAEASVQPETVNPYFNELLDQMRAEGGEETLAHYRDVYARSSGILRLGLDLQGGMYLSYIVDPGPGMEPGDAIDQALEVIRNRIDEFGVSEPSITKQGNDRIVVQLPGVRDPGRARAIVERQALLEFKLVAYPSAEISIPTMIPAIDAIDDYLAAQAPVVDTTSTVFDSTATVVGDSSAYSLPEGLTGDSAASGTAPVPTLPGESVSLPAPVPAMQEGGLFSGLIQSASEEVSRALSVMPGDWVIPSGEIRDQFLEILSRPAVDSILAASNLQFAFTRETETTQGMCAAVFLVPRDMTHGWGSNTAVERPYYLLTGASLTDVYVRMGGDESLSNAPYLILEFDSQGATNWERITGENVEERVGIILDGTLYSVATIRERISSTGTRLSGGFTLEESRDLRLVLKAGSLPARLVIAEEQTIGPSLGQQALNSGLIATIVAFVIVVVFMVVYYGVGGIISIAGLVLSMLMLFAVLCFPGPLAQMGVAGLGATLTLPGLAGIILTIGMAVDANVLIFERIREEKRNGKGIRPAVEAGFARAFTTILDSNLTTLITALVLYRFGTGPIRGFAVTLSVGILVSMFGALVFSRSIFDLLLKKRTRTDINLGFTKFFLGAKYPFVARRKIWYLVSTFVILGGVVAYFATGGFNMSIDFTGGLETNVVTTQHSNVGELSSALTGQGLEGVQAQALEDYEGTGNAFVVRTRTMSIDSVNAALQAAGCTPMEQAAGGGDLSYIKQIGPRVGEELRTKAANAIILSWVAIIIYIWYRFQFKWGLAGVLALVHDTLVTLGFIALVRIEMSLTIIAALLTIIGFSINDTIVVFDRIRENRKLRRGKTFEETVDLSVNETLSRTIITSTTVFLASLALFVTGVGEISNFALTMCVGVITGTYSSIFIASMPLVDWRAKGKKKP
jgi:SecD/SecF fusion protein